MAFLPNSVYVYFEIIEIICPVNNMHAQGKLLSPAVVKYTTILQLILLPLFKRII